MEKVNRATEMFIFDIYIAGLKIREVISDFDNAQSLLHDFRSWDSVIREFEIIGEASKYLLKANLLDKEYQQVVDFRNKITHEYFGIDAEEIWDISSLDLEEYVTMTLKLITKRIVGYAPTHDIYQGMEEAIEWYIESIKTKNVK